MIKLSSYTALQYSSDFLRYKKATHNEIKAGAVALWRETNKPNEKKFVLFINLMER
jgi:hypothetical protein